MALADNDIKSELSYAYLHAVAARAGCECQVTGRHSDALGIDARLIASGAFAPAPSLTRLIVDVQLKATNQTLKTVKGRLAYPLEVEQYNKLRVTTASSPLLLIVLQLPPNPDDWLTCTPRALSLKGCAHWVSLHGAPATTNTTRQTVYLPGRNRFTVEALRSLLGRFAREERVPYVP
jgi:hypothetical protein